MVVIRNKWNTASIKARGETMWTPGFESSVRSSRDGAPVIMVQLP